MWPFDIFRKKKSENAEETQEQTGIVNAETQKTILGEQKDSATFEETAKFNPLSIDSVIGYIKTQNPESSAQDVANIITKLSEPKEDQDHLTPEGDLPWGWRTAHEKETKRYEAKYKKMWSAWYESRYSSPNTQLEALEAFVSYMVRTKKLFEKKGECFNYWRDDLFTDDYLEKLSKELDDLKANIEKLNAEYEAKQEFEIHVLPTLRENLVEIIRENPGILQKDIYKLFDPIAKAYIQEQLYSASKSNQIEREKSGNTYKLYCK